MARKKTTGFGRQVSVGDEQYSRWDVGEWEFRWEPGLGLNLHCRMQDQERWVQLAHFGTLAEAGAFAEGVVWGVGFAQRLAVQNGGDQ